MDVLENVREEDFVEYFIYPQLSEVNENEQDTQLRKVLEICGNLSENLIKGHIWNKDGFKLVLRTSTINKLVDIDLNNGANGINNNSPPHLYGVSHYGDNIEDEWIIVFILLELTKNVPGSVCRICDSDGEFLLIEAADFLPGWIKPETAEKRVYLHNGKVHIIPPELDCQIKHIWENPESTLASEEINNAILRKIRGYPEKINENLHTARVYLPVGVANILKLKPELISPAVHSFCNRDSLDMKICRAMKFFPPEHRVYTNVKFTKYLYAMLVNSKFVPDRRTGWNIPVSGPDNKSHSLGMKLACGFEILISQAKPSLELSHDKSWNKFLEKLNGKQYFRGLLEHSVEYNKLMNTAKEYYINHRDSMYISPLIGQDLLEIMQKNAQFSVDFDAGNLPDEDDDSWLNVDPKQLDEYLQLNYGLKKTSVFNNNSNPEHFTREVSKFLNHMSDVDGVEFPEDSQKESVDKPKQTSTSVNFDADSFSGAVQNILNFVIPEDDSWNLESDSDMSDYEDESEFVKNSEMKDYMNEMDKELARTTIGQSFIKTNENGANENDDFEDIESFKPVDIDMNALKNILESYKSQLGEPGPSTTMLGQLGVQFDLGES